MGPASLSPAARNLGVAASVAALLITERKASSRVPARGLLLPRSGSADGGARPLPALHRLPQILAEIARMVSR